MELSEQQFKILKQMVTADVYFIIIPDLLPEDNDIMKKNHAEAIAMFNGFMEMGFAENLTDKFTESIKELQEERRKIVAANPEEQSFERGFSAYVLTEAAVRMFAAPEGMVN